MHIENISPEEIVKLEIGTGEPIIFHLKNDGVCAARRVLVVKRAI